MSKNASLIELQWVSTEFYIILNKENNFAIGSSSHRSNFEWVSRLEGKIAVHYI